MALWLTNWLVGAKAVCIIFKHHISLSLHLLFIALKACQSRTRIGSDLGIWWSGEDRVAKELWCVLLGGNKAGITLSLTIFLSDLRFVHSAFRNTEKLWMENLFSLLSVGLHSGTGWLPPSEKSGLQSRLDLRAVGPEMSVLHIWDFVCIYSHLTVDSFPSAKRCRVLTMRVRIMYKPEVSFQHEPFETIDYILC